MKTLFILNDQPYGSERSYNALRLAGALSRHADEEIKLFLIGDAAACAKRGQAPPSGYYNIESMLRGLAARNVEVGACGTCLDARGMTEALVEGVQRSGLETLTGWTQWADKVIVF